jgi:hypothetical protein
MVWRDVCVCVCVCVYVLCAIESEHIIFYAHHFIINDHPPTTLHCQHPFTNTLPFQPHYITTTSPLSHYPPTTPHSQRRPTGTQHFISLIQQANVGEFITFDTKPPHHPNALISAAQVCVCVCVCVCVNPPHHPRALISAIRVWECV